MKRLLKYPVLILLLFAYLSLPVHAAKWLWVDHPKKDTIGSVGDSEVLGVVSNKQPYGAATYSAGYFNKKMTLQGKILNATLARDPFVVKHDRIGNVLWAFSIKTSGNGSATAIALDAQENVYVVGTFTGYINFGEGIPIQSNFNPNSMFIAKYTKNGTPVWGRVEGQLTPNQVKVDSAGNVLVTGSFSGTQKIRNVTLQSLGQSDIFLAKYSSSGQGVWAQNAGTVEGSDAGKGITIDSNNNVYMTGFVARGAARFGQTTLPAQIDGKIFLFLAKYNTSGTVVWARVEASGFQNSITIGYGVDCEPWNGNCYVTGSFDSGLRLLINGNYSQLYSKGGKDIFLIKYNSNGEPQWVTSAGGGSFVMGTPATNHDEALAVVMDDRGTRNDDRPRVHITGYYQSIDCAFGQYTLPANGASAAFVASYDSLTGNVTAAVDAGSGGEFGFATGNTISVGLFDDIYVGGQFIGLSSEFGARFNPITIFSNDDGVYDAFIGQFDFLQ